MEHIRTCNPKIYNLLWGEENKEVRQGDIQEEQEDDYNDLPRTVERIIKGDTLRFDRVYKKYAMMDGTVKEYRTEERLKARSPGVVYGNGHERVDARAALWDKYRDAPGIQKAFLYHQLDNDISLELPTEDQDKDRYDFRENIKRYWAEIDNHVCPRCGGAIYQNVASPRRQYKRTETIGYEVADLKIAGYDKPFGERGEFRCVNCLTSFWYCEDCQQFHYMLQENCNIPSVQYELAMHTHDSDALDMCETFDPAFDMFWHNEDDYNIDPMLRTLRDELLKHGDQQVFKYEHTRLNQWLREAELIRQKKTGLRTLDIHNYAGAPQRDHKMTQLERDLFKLEINAFRIARGEYRTGTKIYVKSKPLISKRFIPDKNGDIHQYHVVENRVERGSIYCSGYYTLKPEKLEELEKAQVEACA